MRLWPIALLLAGCPAPSSSDAGPDAPPRDVPGDAGPQALTVSEHCPGAPGCEVGGDLGLSAGAARRPIGPEPGTYERMTTDVNMNSRFDGEEDGFEDLDGDGTFDAAWIAGFGNARPASGVHDENPPWARALCLENGDTRVAFVALDVVGLFIDEIDLIRERVAVLDGAVDWVLVAATHDHESRDSIGIWGASIGETGYDEAYMEHLREQAAQAIREACAALEPVNVERASFFLRDVDTSPEAGLQSDVLRYVGDLRDPFILDDQVRVMRFVAEDGAAPDGSSTVSTLVNFASHPEFEGARTNVISADYAGWMRNGIEEGVNGPDGTSVDGVGGVTVFLNGALGVQIGPNHIHPAEWNGTLVTDDVAQARVVGDQLAYHVLSHLSAPTETVDSMELGFRAARLFVRVENRRYHLAFASGLFGRRGLFMFERRRAVTASNMPYLQTEIAVIDLGRSQMITAPGELDPMLFVGASGDRAFTPDGVPVVDTTRPNPPDLSLAPTGGWLLEHARADAREADDVWLLGCAGDFLGYFVPPFDWELASSPYLEEAEGAHYEETNAVGPDAWPEVERLTRALLDWEP